MATSLYISNERLMAVCGRVNSRRIAIRAYAEMDLPAGSVINGVITNEAAFAEALKQLAGQMGKSFADVRIVLNASRVYVKRAVLPRLPKGKLIELVAGEFTDVDTDADDELIYDCMTLRSLGAGQGNAALICAAKRSLVASYAELFDSLKIRLSGMDTVHAALIKLTGLLPQTREKTFIVLGLDGNTVDATLFTGGEFRLNNRARLIAERGTAESTAEISRMVSSILQFNASERSGAVIGGVFVIGARGGEAAMCASIAAAYDLPATALEDEGGLIAAPGDGTFELSQYAYAVGNLIGA